MATSPIRVLLVTGGIIHDFVGGGRVLRQALSAAGRYGVTEVIIGDKGGVPAFANLSRDQFDVVLLYCQGEKLADDQERGLIRYVESGGGLVAMHCASGSFKSNEGYARLIGCRFKSHPPGTFEYTVKLDDAKRKAGDPLVTRCDDFAIRDEHYLLETIGEIDVFAHSHFDGRNHPMGYQRRQGKGTVVYLANGHDAAALSNRYLQRLLDRSLRVAAGEKFSGSVTAGIIGYGGAFNMGKAHAEAINAQFGMKTIAVCDLDPSRTAQAKVELGEHIRTYNRMDELLAQSDVDLVVTILPHNLHAKACIDASRAGKHVITEKPFCITLEEADEMIAAARDAGKMLSCFHNRRWDGDFHRILQLIRAGEIGDVFHIDAASAGYSRPREWWRASKAVSGGILYDWGAHFCDWTLNFMNKRIASVSGNLQKRYWHQSTNEDFAKAFVRFEDGTTADLEQGTLAAAKRSDWRILGATGAISSDRSQKEFTLVQHVNGDRRETKVPASGGTAAGYYQNIANHLLMGERLIVTPQQARRAIGVLRLAELSSQQGGKPLPLPGEDTYQPDYLIPW